MSLSYEDVKAILAILDELGCEEADIELGDFKLRLRKRGCGDAPEQRPTANDAVPLASRPDAKETVATSARGGPRAEAAPQEGLLTLTAPMVGTFYRASSPGEKPFVEVGDRVGADDTVCLLEVMKLFNSVKSGVTGTVERILVENATLVEYGEPLMLFRPETAPAADQA